jgi:class 3 adenylate cyclase
VSISVTRQEFQEMRDGSMPEDGGDELRPVTALFADIVGSTQLGER